MTLRVGRDRGRDAVGGEALDGGARVDAGDIGADEAGADVRPARRHRRTPRTAASPAFIRAASAWIRAAPRALPIALVEGERRRQRPAVLVGLEAARRHRRPGRIGGRDAALDPRAVARVRERRDQRPRRRVPRRAGCPRGSRCRAGPSATCGSRRRGSRQPGPGSRTSSAASAWTPSTQRSTFAPRRSPASRTTRGDRVHRELDAGARVHPRDRDGARARADRRAQPRGDLVGRRGRRVPWGRRGGRAGRARRSGAAPRPWRSGRGRSRGSPRGRGGAARGRGSPRPIVVEVVRAMSSRSPPR